MRIIIGSDHGGYELKQAISDYLKSLQHEIADVGCYSIDAVDYPDIAILVARGITDKTADVGIMIDGAGIGSSITANKISGIRAALCNDIYTAGNAREHNDANMLIMGSMVIGVGKAKQIAERFLSARFEGGRHQRRVDKINVLDETKSRISPASPDLPMIIREIVQSIIRDNEGTSSKKTLSSVIQTSNRIDPPNLINEDYLRKALDKGIKQIQLPSKVIVTPLARDFARDHGMSITWD